MWLLATPLYVTVPLDQQAGHKPCVLPRQRTITENERKAVSWISVIMPVVIRITIRQQNFYLRTDTFRLIMQ